MLEPYLDMTEEEKEQVIDKVADFIVNRGLAIPAIMYFTVFKPLSFIGSSAMVMAGPAAEIVIEAFTKMDPKLYARVAKLLENRDNVELVIERIEEKDAVLKEHQEKMKRESRRNSKLWRFLYKLVGKDVNEVYKEPEVEDGEEQV